MLSSNQYATKNTYPDDLACLDELSGQPDVLSRGGSAIVGPLGEYVIKPLWDEEGCWSPICRWTRSSKAGTTLMSWDTTTGRIYFSSR